MATNDRGGQISIGKGEGTDFTPVDLLLAAIGGCTAVDVDLLTSRRAEPEKFEVVVDADKVRDEGGNRLTDIMVTFRITFPGGTIVLSHRPTKNSSRFYPGGCLSLISESGSYRIVRGTGRYAGISGHGTYQLSLEIVAARAGGHCSSARPPLGQQELLRLSGPVRR